MVSARFVNASTNVSDIARNKSGTHTHSATNTKNLRYFFVLRETNLRDEQKICATKKNLREQKRSRFLIKSEADFKKNEADVMKT